MKSVDSKKIVRELVEVENDDMSAVLDRHAEAVFRDFHLMTELHTLAVELAATDAATSLRIAGFLDEVGKRNGRSSLQTDLMTVDGDDSIRQLIRERASEVTPQLAASAIEESDRILRTSGPMTTEIADLVLRRGELLAEHLGAVVLTARAHLVRSRLALTKDDYRSAEEHCLKSAELYGRLNDRFNEAKALGQAGSLRISQKRLAEAEPLLRRSLDLVADDVAADGLRASTYEEMGMLLGQRGSLVESVENYREAAACRKRLGHPAREARALRAIVAMGASVECPPEHRLDDAERAVEATLAEAGESDDVPIFAEAIMLCALGPALEVFGIDAPRGPGDETKPNLERARRWFALAKQMRQHVTLRNELTQAHLIDAAGSLLDRDTHAALRHAEAASETAEHAEQDLRLTVALVFCDIALRLGKSEEVLAMVQVARTRDVSMPTHVEQAFTTMEAAALNALGRFNEAFEVTEAAAKPESDAHDWPGRFVASALKSERLEAAFASRDIAELVHGNIELLRDARSLGYREGEASSLMSLGIACGMLGEAFGRDLVPDDRDSLLRAIVDAVPNVGSSTDPDVLGPRLLELAAAGVRALGKYSEAARVAAMQANFEPDAAKRLRAQQDAYVNLRQTGATLAAEAILLANMGKTYIVLGDQAAAETCLARSLDISEEHGAFEWAYDTAAALASLRLGTEGPDEALKVLRKAVDYIELVRIAIPPSDSRQIAFMRGKTDAYSQLVLLNLMLGRDADAFDTLQRMKSRALLRAFGQSWPESAAHENKSAKALIESERDALDRIFAQEARGEQKLVALRQLHRVYDALARVDPRYVARRSGHSLELGVLREVLAAQGRPVLLIDFFVTESSAIAFILRAGLDRPKIVDLRSNAGALQRLGGEIERQVVRYRGRGPATWRADAASLMAPLAAELEPGDLIYLVPHGPLHTLPLHSFPVRGEPLCAMHDVVYLPAASLLSLAELRRPGPPRLASACCIGIDFEDEARAMAALFDSATLLLGPQTADAVAAAIKGPDVIHFSTHGDFVQDTSDLSGLLIGGSVDGQAIDPTTVLNAERIAEMRLDAEIVCLSACKSGLARLGAGDEQLGIQRSFFVAGACSVVSTLWPVDPAATETFMTTFYRKLVESLRVTGRIDKPAAFRAAQIVLRERATDEYSWAAFTLSGDWK